MEPIRDLDMIIVIEPIICEAPVVRGTICVNLDYVKLKTGSKERIDKKESLLQALGISNQSLTTRIQKMTQIITQLQTICHLFLAAKADQVGRQTGFVKREPRLTGAKFLQMLVFGFIQIPDASLEQLSDVAQDLEVAISRQGISQRMTPEAVAFMKRMYEAMLGQWLTLVPLPITLLQQFAHIQLLDSSIISLEANLKEAYPGAGSSKASAKLHVMWDYLFGHLTVSLEAGRSSDTSFWSQVTSAFQAGSLFIADLGYYSTAILREIVLAGAYFISRRHYNTNVYDAKTGQRIDLDDYLAKTPLTEVSLQVEVGRQYRLPCRLIAQKLPAEQVAKRLKRAKRTASRHCQTLSAAHRQRLHWNVFLTNIPSTMLTDQQVVLLYRLRWQIELLFKLWKSEGALDRVVGQKTARVECEWYAKLIGLLLFAYLTTPLRWLDHVELSPTKAWHVFQRRMPRFLMACLQQLDWQTVFTDLFQRWRKRGFKEKRKKTTYTLTALANESPPEPLDQEEDALASAFFAPSLQEQLMFT